MLNRISLIVSFVPTNAFVFASGIFASMGASLTTAELPTSTKDFHIFFVYGFDIAVMHWLRIVCFMALGGSLFLLGVVVENATRGADFMRTDTTTISEYQRYRSGLVQRHNTIIVSCIVAVIWCSVGVVNLSFIA